MGKLEKILQENAAFLQDVTNMVSKVLSDLKMESNQEIIAYHPLTNGHMLRPLLVYITAGSFEKEISKEKREKLVYFAAAVELMHNASLLHDDLLDSEEMRRGKPCLYKQYGFKNGLLAGNIFYIKALELSNQFLEVEQTKDLLDSAITMCEGELLQAKYENQIIPAEIYDQIIRFKTGALTALACRQAANILCSEERVTYLFGKFGEELGVMYQLRDDRKDQDANVEKQFDFNEQIEACNDKVLSYMEELAKTKKIEQFEEIIAYFKKSE